jgi:hypothetical protein
MTRIAPCHQTVANSRCISTMSNNRHNKADDSSFMSTMTFASGAQQRQCDCDECGVVPMFFQEAIKKHKRQRVETNPLRRRQDRSLVPREQGLAVWNLVMPIDAEPLVEFGSSHRLVWVKRLPDSSVLKSIGKGIIGSSDEEKSRTVLDWKEGMILLVPSNGGKAIGWEHTAANAVATHQQPSHAVLFVIKIPQDQLPQERLELSDVDEHSWVKVAQYHCQKALEQAKGKIEPQQLATEDCQLLQEVLTKLSPEGIQPLQPTSNEPSDAKLLQAVAAVSKPDEIHSSIEEIMKSLDESKSLFKHLSAG